LITTIGTQLKTQSAYIIYKYTSNNIQRERETDTILYYIRNIHVKLNFQRCDACNDNNVNHTRRIRQYNQHLVITRLVHYRFAGEQIS